MLSTLSKVDLVYLIENNTFIQTWMIGNEDDQNDSSYNFDNWGDSCFQCYFKHDDRNKCLINIEIDMHIV